MNRLVSILAAALLAASAASQAKPFFDPSVDPSTVRPPPPAPTPLTLAEIEKLSPGEKVKAGRALWEYKCATEAGEKIYKTVPDVEGILLMKLRPSRGDWELGNPDWPGAAFAREWPGEGYIFSFLGYEQPNSNPLRSPEPRPITPKDRGYINEQNTPEARNGYRWVDVIDDKDGSRWRYSGRWDEPWQYDKSYLKGHIKFFLDKMHASDTAPRYGVTFEDHVIPEERALGVASSTIKVLDLETNETLGELTRYAVAGTPGKYNPRMWLTAYVCPTKGSSGSLTRKFTDQILIPTQQKK